MMRNIFLSFVLLVFGFRSARAQEVPYLEKPITLTVNDRPIAEIFKSITEQTSVLFSYTGFNDQKRISIRCYQKPLRIALSEILSTSNCTYKAKGKYIIIKCSESPVPLTYSEVSGYVYNAEDSSKIDLASIYIEKTKHSSLTNEYGYFIISSTETSPKISLTIAKENYYDTTLVVYKPKEASVIVYLHPKPVKKETAPVVPPPVKPDSIVVEKKDSAIAATPDFLKKFREKFKTFNANFKNIGDTLFSGFSVSLLPYISTNRLLSINTVNRYSLNILAGYSKGVSVMEIGGVVNIDDGDVKYFQIAGIGNVVSGNFSGMQTGGIFNINHQRTNGMQIAGIYNKTYTMNGWQIAGILNESQGQYRGMQLSGLINKADTLKGFQLAGLINSAQEVQGVQVSAFMNKACSLKGVQFGFLNISDTCSGVPIGFFSYVKTGYHKIELAADELSFATISFGSGSDYFHNIFIGGVNFRQTDLWTYGYGIGSGCKLSKRWNLSFDATGQQLQSSKSSEISLNLLGRFFLGVEYAPFSKLRIGIGPSYNVLVADITGDHYQPILDILPSSSLYNQTQDNDINVKTWIGAKLSVKFL